VLQELRTTREVTYLVRLRCHSSAMAGELSGRRSTKSPSPISETSIDQPLQNQNWRRSRCHAMIWIAGDFSVRSSVALAFSALVLIGSSSSRASCNITTLFNTWPHRATAIKFEHRDAETFAVNSQ